MGGVELLREKGMYFFDDVSLARDNVCVSVREFAVKAARGGVEERGGGLISRGSFNVVIELLGLTMLKLIKSQLHEIMELRIEKLSDGVIVPSGVLALELQ